MGEGLSDWAVWNVVQQSADEIGIERLGAQDLRRTCAKLCRKAGGDLNRSSSARACVHLDHRAVSRVRAGDRRRGEQ